MWLRTLCASMMGALLVASLAANVAAQVDTTRREFWPLDLGDLWQYRDDYGQLAGTWQVCVVDTQLPNGQRYAALGVPANLSAGYSFDRIDTLLRVQWYAPWAGDSCGGSSPQEASVYRLGEDSGAVWKDCYNWNGFLGPALIRYMGIRHQSVFGQVREVMLFQHGYISPETGDTTWPTEDRLARGIGLIWRGFWYDVGYEYLAAAIISGDTFGLVAATPEIPKEIPRSTRLLQNYPNPFNARTVLEYDIPRTAHVLLKVLNIVGQEIEVLVDETQVPGRYRAVFDGGRFSSGSYICVLIAGEVHASCQMLLVR